MIKRRYVLRAGLLGGLALSALRCARPAAQRHPGAGGSRAARPSAGAAATEGLIGLIEDTKPDRLIEVLGAKIREGLAPDELLAALYAAGTRNVLTGREFSTEQHILLCVYSAHQASGMLPSSLHWRPLLWAADFFKSAQAKVAEYEPSPMQPLAECRVPGPGRALREFQEAMDTFEGPRAEAAIAGLHRSTPRGLVIETLLRYGSKDFRHIGHKAIHVSNGLATLDLVGWQGSEEVLRSIASTLALHYDEEGRDPDRSWVSNQAVVSSIRDGWATGSPNDDAVRSLLTTLREGDPDRACAEVVRWLNLGSEPRSLWDAMLLSSAELLLNNPRSVEALHAVTASNAAYMAFERARDDGNRRLLLLQNAARVADFHDYVAYWAARRDRPPTFDVKLEELEPAAVSSPAQQGVEEIFADIGQSPEAMLRAAKRTLQFLDSGAGTPKQLFTRAIEIISSRANDSHDFKLAAATMDDLPRLSPQWRARYLAACTVRFRGSAEPKSELAERFDALGL